MVWMQRSGPGEVGLGLPEPKGPGAGELAGGLPEVFRGDAQGDQVPLIFFLSYILFILFVGLYKFLSNVGDLR